MQQENAILTKNFCRHLKEARGDRSQAEFARFLGIPAQQTYQRYETGQSMPDGLILHQIATRLGVSIDYLLSDSTQKSYHVEEGPEQPYGRAPKYRSLLKKVIFIEENGTPEQIELLDALLDSIQRQILEKPKTSS